MFPAPSGTWQKKLAVPRRDAYRMLNLDSNRIVCQDRSFKVFIHPYRVDLRVAIYRNKLKKERVTIQHQTQSRLAVWGRDRFLMELML